MSSANANMILDGTNVDLGVFSYSAPKANSAGGKVVNLYNKYAKESLTIAVPMMGSWGAQESKEVIGKSADGKPITRGTGKYSMALQFSKGQYTTPESEEFLKQMKLVENKIKTDAMTYSKEWFGKQINSMDVMDEKISPMLKYPKVKGSEERNYDEPPQLSVKLPCWKDVWQTSVFDEDYKQLYVKGKTELGVTPLDYLVSTSKAPIQVICLIQCGGLWFVGNPAKVSITWNLKQVIVKKPKMSSIADDTCFLHITATDREVMKSLPETETLQDTASVSVFIEESDDETYVPPKQNIVPSPNTQVNQVSAEQPTDAPNTKEPVASAPADEPTIVKKKVVKKKVDA